MSQSGLNFDIRGNWMGGPALNRMNGDLRRARGNIDATAVAGKRFSEALGGSSWRRQVQQAGMQISDFSVQVAGGQSAILAFTQNAPQFIQNFGAMGGVIAAVVTIAGTFAFAASRMGESVKEMTKETDETVKALGSYKDALSAVDPVAYEIFEKAAKAIRSTSVEARNLLDITQRGALLEFGQDVESLAGGTGENVSMKWLKGVNVELAEFLGLALRVEKTTFFNGQQGSNVMAINPQIVAFARDIRDLQASSTGTLQDQVTALGAVRDNLLSIVGGAQKLNMEQANYLTLINQQIMRTKEFIAAQNASTQTQQNAAKAMQATQLRYGRSRTAAGQAYNAILTEQAALIARGTSAANAFANTLDNEALAAIIKTFEASKKLREELGDAAFEALSLAGVDMASGVDAAAKAAARLAANLGISLNAAISLRNMQSGRQYSGRGSGAEYYGTSDYQNELGYKPVDQLIAEMTKKKSGGAGAGKTKLTDAQRDAEKLRDILKEADPVLKEILQGTEDLTLKTAKRIEDSFMSMRDTISQAMLGSFKSLLDGTKSLGESVRDILGSIVDKVIDLLMTPIFNNIAGGIAGGLTGVIGGLGGNLFAGSFEGGGFTGGGPRAGGLDGRGGRLAMVHPNESIYDHTRGQGGGGVTVNMTVVTQDAPSFQKSRRQIERGLASAMQRGAAA